MSGAQGFRILPNLELIRGCSFLDEFEADAAILGSLVDACVNHGATRFWFVSLDPDLSEHRAFLCFRRASSAR